MKKDKKTTCWEFYCERPIQGQKGTLVGVLDLCNEHINDLNKGHPINISISGVRQPIRASVNNKEPS